MKTLPVCSALLLVAGCFLLNPMNACADAADIQSVTVGEPVVVPNNHGDTWVTAWTRDGRLFTPSNDSYGFSRAGNGNLLFNELYGDTALTLTGSTVGLMVGYGRECEKLADGCTWKSSGCVAVNGALYWLVARHNYGETSGDKLRRQSATNASIIKSTDGGKTWTRSAKENYEEPMFTGSRFTAPYFIDYGQEGRENFADGADRYIYALSNNGFWDNGDNVILGRIERGKMAAQNAKDWQFYKGGDGLDDANWSSEQADAKLVIDMPNHLGMTGAAYLAGKKCYLMVAWHYPMGSGKQPGSSNETQWEFLVAQHPWGPWRKVGEHNWKPQGYYCPNVCLKLTPANNSVIQVVTGGDFNNGKTYYKLTVVPVELK